jgi:hypothetical protein
VEREVMTEFLSGSAVGAYPRRYILKSISDALNVILSECKNAVAVDRSVKISDSTNLFATGGLGETITESCTRLIRQA